MLKSVMNVLMVPVLGFALLIAVSHADVIPGEPGEGPVLVLCDNVGCAWDDNNNGCWGQCDELRPGNCTCILNPLFDSEDDDTGTKCFCNFTP